MLPRIQAQLHEVRLDLHGRWLRRQELAALRRLGEEVASRPDDGEREELRQKVWELGEAKRRIEALAAEGAASLDADRTDLSRVAAWAKPVVIARGVCTRAVLRHRAGAARRMLRPRYEALGALAASASVGRAGSEVTDARTGLEQVLAERERRVASFGGTAHPAWTRRAIPEVAGLARAIVSQLRSALLPKAPALAGLAVGWWIANTYTDSRARSVLRSVGIGSGGTHVVSGATYKWMSFWLPLLAAAVCAYLGERIVEHYRHRARAAPVESGEEAA